MIPALFRTISPPPFQNQRYSRNKPGFTGRMPEARCGESGNCLGRYPVRYAKKLEDWRKVLLRSRNRTVVTSYLTLPERRRFFLMQYA